ncbi:Nn.00g080050.m01.CDS01 [Neocucurbitaria sp. VM-36]
MDPESSQKDSQSYHLKVAIVYAAYAEVLTSTAHLISPDEGGSSRLRITNDGDDKSFHDMCELAAMYLSLQYNLFGPGGTASQGVTEDDLKTTFGLDYEDIEHYVFWIESILKNLTNCITLKPNYPRLLRRRTQFEKDIRDVVHDMRSRDEDDGRESAKTVQLTQTVLDVFRANTTKPDWSGIQVVRDNVKWNMDPKDTKRNLFMLRRSIESLRDTIGDRQIYPWPDFSQGTPIAYWMMDSTAQIEESQLKPADTRVSYDTAVPQEYQKLKDRVEIRALGNGKQSKVLAEHFSPRGKYRGVCKLFLKCRTDKDPHKLTVFVGSGWLYDDKTVVTAGHCLYDTKTSRDPKKNYGRIQATSIAVYLGWGSAQSSDHQPELRRATCVLTHRTWLDRRAPECDVGIIRLKSPFTSSRMFPIARPMPTSGVHQIFVVGYPADTPPYVKEPADSEGNVMYESAWDVDFSSMASGLRYRADTAGGNSGSPVLWHNARSGSLEVVGTHVAWANETTNRATSLYGYGIDVPRFADALRRVEQVGGGMPGAAEWGYGIWTMNLRR